MKTKDTGIDKNNMKILSQPLMAVSKTQFLCFGPQPILWLLPLDSDGGLALTPICPHFQNPAFTTNWATGTTHPNLTKYTVHVACSHALVPLW